MIDSKPALFLDRDGILNVDRGYVAKVEDFEWVDGAVDCLRNFMRRDWFIFIVTNQSGIAMGHYTQADMQAVHDHMTAGFHAAGVAVDQIYACPFHPEGTVPEYRKDSFDRKPKPGMVLQALADYPVKKDASFLIGDKPTDVAAAHAAGIGGFLFKGGNIAQFAEWSLASFEDGSR